MTTIIRDKTIENRDAILHIRICPKTNLKKQGCWITLTAKRDIERFKIIYFEFPDSISVSMRRRKKSAV